MIPFSSKYRPPTFCCHISCRLETITFSESLDNNKARMRNHMAAGWFYSPSQIAHYLLSRPTSLKPPRVSSSINFVFTSSQDRPSFNPPFSTHHFHSRSFSGRFKTSHIYRHIDTPSNYVFRLSLEIQFAFSASLTVTNGSCSGAALSLGFGMLLISSPYL
jgi:hypothetical protein